MIYDVMGVEFSFYKYVTVSLGTRQDWEGKCCPKLDGGYTWCGNSSLFDGSLGHSVYNSSPETAIRLV